MIWFSTKVVIVVEWAFLISMNSFGIQIIKNVMQFFISSRKIPKVDQLNFNTLSII